MLLKEINEDYSGSKAHQLVFDILQKLNQSKQTILHKSVIELTGPLATDSPYSCLYFNTSLSLKKVDNQIQLIFSEYEIFDYNEANNKIKHCKNRPDYLTSTILVLQEYKPIVTDNDQFYIVCNSSLDVYDIMLDICNCLMDNDLVPLIMHNEIDFGTIINTNYYQSHLMLFEIIQSIIDFNLTNLNAHIVNEFTVRHKGYDAKANIRLCYTSADDCILIIVFKDNREFQSKINTYLKSEQYEVYYDTFANQHGEIQVTISPSVGQDLLPMVYEILDKIT